MVALSATACARRLTPPLGLGECLRFNELCHLGGVGLCVAEPGHRRSLSCWQIQAGCKVIVGSGHTGRPAPLDPGIRSIGCAPGLEDLRELAGVGLWDGENRIYASSITELWVDEARTGSEDLDMFSPKRKGAMSKSCTGGCNLRI